MKMHRGGGAGRRLLLELVLHASFGFFLSLLMLCFQNTSLLFLDCHQPDITSPSVKGNDWCSSSTVVLSLEIDLNSLINTSYLRKSWFLFMRPRTCTVDVFLFDEKKNQLRQLPGSRRNRRLIQRVMKNHLVWLCQVTAGVSASAVRDGNPAVTSLIEKSSNQWCQSTSTFLDRGKERYVACD